MLDNFRKFSLPHTNSFHMAQEINLSNTDFLRQWCFSNNPVYPTAITHVCRATTLTLASPWYHPWWIKIFRSKWNRYWSMNDTTLPLVEGAMETLESWNPMCGGNPRSHDGIIKPLIQISTKGGCRQGIRGGGIPLSTVPPMHLQMEVMNKLDDTKTTPIKLQEPTLER